MHFDQLCNRSSSERTREVSGEIDSGNPTYAVRPEKTHLANDRARSAERANAEAAGAAACEGTQGDASFGVPAESCSDFGG
jgi:hypothetical protein